MLDRGVSMRSIYQHTARYDGPTVAYVERMTAVGAQIRTLGDALMRMIVFDREIGIMEVRGDRTSAVVIREPNIVDFMGTAFDRAWITAEPFPLATARDDVRQVSNELSRLITTLLAEGRDDKSIARRLGMSERTCQRYVREILSAHQVPGRLPDQRGAGGVARAGRAARARRLPRLSAVRTRSCTARPGPDSAVAVSGRACRF
jgi:hypothetical protein